ncbi:MAG: DUF1801 domain-containing protein [Carboxylicivirga sp.]|jgi:hypothetical protein|nr:DUF1801 domain-containing protein [Carboxylicivirga sp.]
MKKLIIKSDPKVNEVFSNYPEDIRAKMDFLRGLIIETAHEMQFVNELTETLKWGEPSYITKHGSTLRIDWKKKTPDQYSMYFQCSSRLVKVFRTIFKERFQFEANRVIIFQSNQKIPVWELKACIKAALHYHKVKHLINLGI